MSDLTAHTTHTLLHFRLLRQYILSFVKANKVYNSDFVPQVRIHITLFKYILVNV